MRQLIGWDRGRAQTVSRFSTILFFFLSLCLICLSVTCLHVFFYFCLSFFLFLALTQSFLHTLFLTFLSSSFSKLILSVYLSIYIFLFLSLSLSLSIYIYIYIYICVCVCMCVLYYIILSGMFSVCHFLARSLFSFSPSILNRSLYFCLFPQSVLLYIKIAQILRPIT